MKRDMDLVRRLLVLIEDADPNSELVLPDDLDRLVVAYHLEIMEQAGYTRNKITYADNKPYWIFASLTWDGHEFLDAIRNESVWKKIKDVVKQKGGSIPFDVLKTLAIDTARKYFLE